MGEDAISKEFPLLSKYLAEAKGSLAFDGKYLIPKTPLAKKPIPLLKHYFVGPEIRRMIKHNLDWASGKKSKPVFKFAYLMLPTGCNQKCVGCFTGKDKGFLPEELSGRMFSKEKIDEVIDFLKEHRAEAIIYGGGGELFCSGWAFDFIEQITSAGLAMFLFTHGSILSKEDIQKIASKEISLIISLRDTVEKEHDKAVGIKGFRKTLKALEYALDEGMHKENKLAVEIPVTVENETRVLYDLIPVLRSIEVIPLVEEFIQIMTSENEKRVCHSFSEAREFFKKVKEIDEKFGYEWKLENGVRTVDQPKCERPLYSFTVYPSGDITDCPCHSVNYGNFYYKPLGEIIYSNKFKNSLLNFELCACSVFYTKENEVPANIPEYLQVFT